ncbi:MAG TPA: substrate-binding domain-containing protein, partial [Thermoleophilaceae bacterium]|nr:substrate-binding domain-containing protein [Thermoleophilaceae bacterium]
EADTVLLDNRGGARRAVEHLIAHGHERIACVADAAQLYTARERLAGYHEALGGAGIAADELLVASGNRDSDAASTAVAQLMRLPSGRGPSAIFAANNRNTVGALRALAACPRPPALVGFDDFELADLLGTTVVRADPWRLGEQGAALAFARLDGDARPAQRIVVPTELIPRGSGEVRA